MKLTLITLFLLLAIGSSHGWFGKALGHLARHAIHHAHHHYHHHHHGEGGGGEEQEQEDQDKMDEQFLDDLKKMDEDQYEDFMDQLGQSLTQKLGEDEAASVLRTLDELVQGESDQEENFDQRR